MNYSIGDLETLLIFMLESGGRKGEKDTWMGNKEKQQNPDRAKNYKLFISDASSVLGLPDRSPHRSYTFDACDDERLLTYSHEYLMTHPKEIIEGGAETVMLCENNIVKWSGIYPMNRRPKRASCLGKADCWFELHYREGNSATGWSEYHKHIAAIHSSGRPLPVQITGQHEPPNIFNSEMVIGACSVVEDAHRSNAVLATISADSEIILPVHQDIYQEFFRLRDAPRNTATGRRNPIIHMVASHMRTRGEKSFNVKRHYRGVESITIDGLSVSLEPQWGLEA